jgi:photosystem II stability/assembly factor-like uncharacterized protein
MRKFFFIPLLLFLFTSQFDKTYSQDYWFNLNSPTTNFLRALHFADSLTGWVAGDSGLIIHTTNGGLDWIEQQSNTNNNIKDIFFLDENWGWAISWNEFTSPIGTVILSTSNGGDEWTTELYRDENVFMNSIYFLDTLNGWMGGFPGEMVYTTDGGVVWTDAVFDSGAFIHFPPVRFNFYSPQYAFVCGGAIDIAGVIWRTTNGGESWSASGVSPEPVQQLHFIDSLNIIGLGGDPEFFGASVVRTTNGGDDWVHEELGIFGVATSVSFRTESEGWAPLSFAQTMIFSLDTGFTWTEIPTLNNLSIYELVFTDTLTGYGVGSEGAIIKYKYPNTTPYIEQKQSLPPKFILFQNYPNPFNPVTTLKYSIPLNSHVQLVVYDPLGNKVAILEDAYKQKGSHETIWNSGDFPSGIYYYQLKVGSYTDTKKMILLK